MRQLLGLGSHSRALVCKLESDTVVLEIIALLSNMADVVGQCKITLQ